MASVNKVIIVGNVGRDPETRYMPSGDAVTNISVATSDRYKDKQTGEMKENTEWHRIAFFGKLAEIAGQYLKKVHRCTSRVAYGLESGRIKVDKKSIPPRSLLTACKCSVHEWLAPERNRQAVVLNLRRAHLAQAPVHSMQWMTIFRFSITAWRDEYCWARQH